MQFRYDVLDLQSLFPPFIPIHQFFVALHTYYTSMGDVAIKIENLSKQYRLGVVGTGTLSHDLKRWWTVNMRGKEDPYLKIGETNDRSTKANSEYVWALKDINLEIKQGDVVGIIGKNGAGKSTLLKILSKVTKPTTGTVQYKGRIASLLEVGTGFHMEMTGRENIYMNGSIMGMPRTEITRKLEEIIDFAGVERFIDTPVKRYSSGMMVRLGFAIAAHLEPDILVVDEVLAVGDAEFQKKAIGKMQDVSKGEGRTVLFVSHNMASIKALCSSGNVLSSGNLIYSGSVSDAINFYLENYSKVSQSLKLSASEVTTNENIQLLNFEISPSVGKVISVESGINFFLVFMNFVPNIMLDVTFELSTINDVCVFHNGIVLTPDFNSEKGCYKIQFSLPAYLINAGKYKIKIIFGENQKHPLFIIDQALSFEVENSYSDQGYNHSILPGIIKPKIDYKWEFSKNE